MFGSRLIFGSHFPFRVAQLRDARARGFEFNFRQGQECGLSYFDAESFDNGRKASCSVVINCAGKMMVEFFSTEISAIVWRVRS